MVRLGGRESPEAVSCASDEAPWLLAAQGSPLVTQPLLPQVQTLLMKPSLVLVLVPVHEKLIGCATQAAPSLKNTPKRTNVQQLSSSRLGLHNQKLLDSRFQLHSCGKFRRKPLALQQLQP